MPKKSKVEKWSVPACRHPEHNPPGMISLPPGAYEHSCPACGHSTTFTVSGPTMHRPFAQVAARGR